MHLTVRTIVAGVVGVASLLAMSVGCFNRSIREGKDVAASEPRTTTRSDTAVPSAEASAEQWTSVTSPTIDADIRSAVSSSIKMLVDGGMTTERSRLLEDDLVTIMKSLFSPDYDLYDKLMASKGCQLDTIADGFSNAVVEWKLYPDETPDLAADAPTRTRVRYLWNHPDKRNFQWSAFRPASTIFGFGMVLEYNSPDWPYQGVYSQLSMYIPASGRLQQEDGDRLSRSKDAVWFLVEGRFASGMQTRMRIELYYDSKVNTWIPIYIHLGNDGKHRPFPMI